MQLARVGVNSCAPKTVLLPVTALDAEPDSGLPVEMLRACSNPIVPLDAPESVTEIRVDAELMLGQYHISAPAPVFGVGHATASLKTLVVLSVIDNLVKGAAGQAVQNMNLMFGLAEDAGLKQVALLP